MTDWISRKKKEQRRGALGSKGKPDKQKFYIQIKKPNDTQIVEFDYKEDKKPHSTKEGQKASLERSFKRFKPVIKTFKGGGIASGMRRFNKGGKV